MRHTVDGKATAHACSRKRSEVDRDREVSNTLYKFRASSAMRLALFRQRRGLRTNGMQIFIVTADPANGQETDTRPFKSIGTILYPRSLVESLLASPAPDYP
jgi:hypothetical protein